MSLLLDTHVWIWSQELPEQIGPNAKQRLADASEPLYVATISTLEIARLLHLDLLALKGSLSQWVAESIEAMGCISIELSHAIAAAAYDLPGEFHKDPADRLLVATARVQDLTLLTADDRILGYPHVRSLDARR